MTHFLPDFRSRIVCEQTNQIFFELHLRKNLTMIRLNHLCGTIVIVFFVWLTLNAIVFLSLISVQNHELYIWLWISIGNRYMVINHFILTLKNIRFPSVFRLFVYKKPVFEKNCVNPLTPDVSKKAIHT